MLGAASFASAGGSTFSCRVGAAVTGGAVTGFDGSGADTGIVCGGVVAEPTSLEGCTAGVLLAVIGAGGVAEDVTATVGHRCP